MGEILKNAWHMYKLCLVELKARKILEQAKIKLVKQLASKL